MFRKGILMLSPFGTYRNVPAVKNALFRAANLSSSGGIALVKWLRARSGLLVRAECMLENMIPSFSRVPWTSVRTIWESTWRDRVGSSRSLMRWAISCGIDLS